MPTTVIACDKRKAFAQGSESDEAIHASVCGGMDCFASLAMTGGAKPTPKKPPIPAATGWLTNP